MKPNEIINELNKKHPIKEALGFQTEAWLRLLASTNALYTFYYTCHWKAKGPNYYGDHELYGRLYEAVHCDIDKVAEKAIGVTNDDSFITPVSWTRGTLAKLSEWDPNGENDARAFPARLLAAQKEHIAMISAMKSNFEEEGTLTDGIDAFLTGLVDKHEAHVYLLQQRMK